MVNEPARVETGAGCFMPIQFIGKCDIHSGEQENGKKEVISWFFI
jgi:hypothetical protein